MKKRFDIIGLENGIVDLALQMDEMPRSGTASKLKNYLWQPGGNVNNAIAAAARQGAVCGYLGTVGNDSPGEFYRRDLEMHGVDTSHLFLRKGTTTLALCLAEEKHQERSFLVYSGNSGSPPPDLTPEDIDEEYISAARYLHIGHNSGDLMQDAVAVARRNGVIVSVDGASLTDYLAWTLDNCDIMIMSKAFYTGLFGQDVSYVSNMKKLIAEKGMETCIVTLGPDGCAGANSSGEKFRIPAFSGYDIIDTTGAGDVFHGGFLYAHSRGWSLEKCARYASAVSFIKCTSLGGRVGIPDRKAVEQFLADGTISVSDLDQRKKHYGEVMHLG